MLGIDDAVASVSKLLDDGLNKIFPDPSQKATAEALVIKAHNDAAIALLSQQMSVMLAEAQSKDPWTSRARPSFLYVMYVMILVAIPMGFVAAFRPDVAASVAQGMRAWLAAIPDAMWNMFGLCFTGYTISRGYEKVKGATK